MPENWSRRALLASFGAFSLAGCIARDQDGGVDATRTTSPAARTTSPGNETTSEPRDEPTVPERIDADWPMPASDAGRSNYAAATSGPTGPVAELWHTTADASLSAPVLADETLFVGGDDGVVRAIDARTGEERWRGSVGVSADTPWVIDDRLVVPTAEGIVALDARDGTEAWRADTPGRAAVLVASHGVYWLRRQATPSVVGLAREDGSERWRTEIGDPWDPHLFASDESVFVSSGTHDRIPWTLAPDTGEVVGTEPRSGHDFPAERFYLDGTIYAVDSFFGNVVASSVDEGGRGWSQGVAGLGDSALSGGSSRVYYLASAGEKPGLYALSQADGTVEWHTAAVTEVVGRPVVAGETILVRTDDALRCFDPADGTERWSRPGDDVGEQFVVADDLVYATQGDTLRAFRPP